MKLDNFYHSRFSDYCLHRYYNIHKVSADVSSGILQVFFLEFGNLHRTLNHVLYLSHEESPDSINYNQIQVLSIPVLLLVCSQGLQIIVI